MERTNFLIGGRTGTGNGFGTEKSTIVSGFRYLMGDWHIEIKNELRFEPAEEKPDGEYLFDRGFISFDKIRNRIVYRQFNIEGCINQ